MPQATIATKTQAPAKADTAVRPAGEQDVLVYLAGRLTRRSAETQAAQLALEATDKHQTDPRRVNPPPQVRAAEELVKACQAREKSSYFAREQLELRAAIAAAAPAIEARIADRRAAADRERANLQTAAGAVEGLRNRRDALSAQRDAIGTRQTELDAAQARLAGASDAGDDARAETAAREIANIRREQRDRIEPLELRQQAGQAALERAEAQQAEADARLADAEKALREAELDRLRLAHDEAAAALRERAIELAAAGHFVRGASTEFDVGLAPEVLDHLGGKRLRVTHFEIAIHGERRRMALEHDRPDAR